MEYYFVSIETRLIVGAIATIISVAWCIWADHKMKKK